jgi:NADP-dependent 3-hydroxy acid dehydrogenase YdfG
LKVLIIGGTASITHEMIKQLEFNNYEIDLMTYRQKNKIYGNYKWKELNFENQQQVFNFLNSLQKNYYSKIIINVGSSFIKNYNEGSFKEFETFYKTYLLNYIYIMMNLPNNLTQNGQIVSISSEIANRPYKDIHYSAVKAGCQIAAQGLSLHLKEGQSIYSIAPGLIDLKIKKQIAKIIVESTILDNGKVIEIGY